MNYGESEQNDRRIIASILKGWSLISLYQCSLIKVKNDFDNLNICIWNFPRFVKGFHTHLKIIRIIILFPFEKLH